MADVIVNFLAEKLTTLLVDEVKLLTGGAQDKVKSLCRELMFMKAFLNDTQGNRKENDVVAQVVSQIRDVAHEAEDVIDDIIQRRGMKIFNPVMLHNVASKIDSINTTIKQILDNKDRYGIITEGGGRRRDRGDEAEHVRKQRSEVEEDLVAGFESYSRVVIDQLLMPTPPRPRSSSPPRPRLKVVSIIGMGGLGKTTLARKIFNDDRVIKNTFPCRAWGYVSNEHRSSEFFLSLLKCLLPEGEYNDLSKRGEGNEELKMKVRECLNRGGKYLVVVDDVWETQAWDEIKGGFPDNNGNESRILMTTRRAKVATHAGATFPYSLPFLNKQKSWELLFKKVFRARGLKCDSGFQRPDSPARLIAEKCDGLPLAIIVMAGILVNKSSPGEWSKIYEHMNLHLGDKDNILNHVLKLSYHTLPARLKPCFLYFGMYPEDYKITVKRLIQLWISEGLVTHESSETIDTREPEYIARLYLDELVDQSLVQVVHRNSDGSVKTCRIHRVLRLFCISESMDDNLFKVCGKINDFQNNSRSRRLSLHGTLFPVSDPPSISGTHSLLCFGEEASEVKPNWTWFLKSFKLARVLDLGKMNVNSLPTDLKKLTHLRYLRIHSLNLETIPDSICKLWNLETLDLRDSPIKSFSGAFWQLKKLRNLLMVGPVGLPVVPPSEPETVLPNLQTLSTVALDLRTASLLDNGRLTRFPGLRKLGLHYERDMCNPRVQLKSLYRLSHLQKLKLIGTTEIPQDAADVFPSNITKITLTKFGDFNSSVMNTLGKLPNLEVLKLSSQKSNASFDVHCAAGGFPKLQVFVMDGIKVESWRVVKDSMPHVGRVVVRNFD